MKKVYTSFILLIVMLFGATLIAQEQQKTYINYQGVAREANGDLMSNTSLKIDVQLKFGSSSSSPLYVESHAMTTDANGVFSLLIGKGNSIAGDYENLPWGTEAAFAAISLNGNEIGTTELMAVPYALSSADNQWHFDGSDIENKNNGNVFITGSLYASQDLSLAEGAAIKEFSTDITMAENSDEVVPTQKAIKTYVDGKVGGTGGGTDDQTAAEVAYDNSASGLTATTAQDAIDELVGGGSVDADSDPTNEIQDISLSGTELSISNGSTIDLAPIVPPGGTDDQELTFNVATKMLEIEDGNIVDLSSLSMGGGGSLWTDNAGDIYYNSGKVGVGTSSPESSIAIETDGNQWNLTATEGDFRIGDATHRLKMGVAIDGAGAGDARIRVEGGTDRMMLGGGTNDVLTITDANVGVGTITPAVKLHVDGSIRSNDLSGVGERNVVADANGNLVIGVGGGGGSSTGLEAIDEGSGIGWRLIGTDPTEHGPVGENAVDLSHSNDGLATSGATGSHSTAMGESTRAAGGRATSLGHETSADGQASVASGFQTQALGDYSVSMGRETIASGTRSVAMNSETSATADAATSMGFSTRANGRASVAMGIETKADALSSLAIGRFNVGGGNNTNWVGSDPIFEIGNGDGPGVMRANAFTVLKNGRVGIGTHTPTAQLEIMGNIRSTDLAGVGERNVVADANGNLIIGAGGGGGSLWTLNGSDIHYNTGNVGIGTASPDEKLHVEGDLFVNSGLGSIKLGHTATNDQWHFSTISGGKDLQFGPRPSGGSYSTKFRMHQTGEFSVGQVASPNAWLHIQENSTVSKAHLLLEEKGDDFARLELKNDQSSAFWHIAGIGKDGASGAANSDLNFYFRNDQGAANRLTVKGSGRVGIGTTNPSARLHVAGDIRSTDLAGAGERNVVADANGNLIIGAGGGGSSPWSENAGNVYFNGGNVGIGTNTPDAPLEISTSNSRQLILKSTGNDNYMQYITPAGFVGYSGVWSGNNDVDFGTTNSNATGKVHLTTGATPKLTVAANGDVGIGTTNPSAKLVVKDNSTVGKPQLKIEETENDFARIELSSTTNGAFWHIAGIGQDGVSGAANSRLNFFFQNNQGSANRLTITGDGDVLVSGSLVHSSDMRLKKNIFDLPYGLEQIVRLEPKIYSWMDNRNNGSKSLGLIAQDVKKIIPEIVREETDSEKTLSLSYSELIPVIISAVKEQQKIIERQSEKISYFEERLKMLEAKIGN